MAAEVDAVVPGHAGTRRVADRLALAVAVALLAIIMGVVTYCGTSQKVVRVGRYGIMGPNAHPRMTVRFKRLVTRRRTDSNVTVYQFGGGPYWEEILSAGGLHILHPL